MGEQERAILIAYSYMWTGKCVSCSVQTGKNLKFATCKECRQKSHQKSYPRNRIAIVKQVKARADTLLAAGLCRQCGKGPLVNKHRCAVCTERKNAIRRARAPTSK